MIWKALFVGSAAIMLFAAQEAAAQQFNQPFSFRVHNNSAALTQAIYMKQFRDGATSSATTSSSGSSGNPGSVTIYSSSTVGNLNEITQILEAGAEGYIGAGITQDGSDSSQSASTDGTQIFDGDTNTTNVNTDDGKHHK